MLSIKEANVIGIRSYSFKGDDGRDVFMSQIYCTFSDSKTDGLAACMVSISERKVNADGIEVGSVIRIAFANKRWEYVGA